MAKLGDMADEERREWFIRNDNFVIEEPTLRSRDGGDVEPRRCILQIACARLLLDQ